MHKILFSSLALLISALDKERVQATQKCKGATKSHVLLPLQIFKIYRWISAMLEYSETLHNQSSKSQGRPMDRGVRHTYFSFHNKSSIAQNQSKSIGLTLHSSFVCINLHTIQSHNCTSPPTIQSTVKWVFGRSFITKWNNVLHLPHVKTCLKEIIWSESIRIVDKPRQTDRFRCTIFSFHLEMIDLLINVLCFSFNY